ncbi:MAG: hypothetical protein QOD58_206, partial [Mycobacterium sp.]|nr:hypothetical protein [Mycobacterium sp.]
VANLSQFDLHSFGVAQQVSEGVAFDVFRHIVRKVA